MVDRLNSLAFETTRVQYEIGLEGIFGGQADVRRVTGTWKDVVDSVNNAAARLTVQIRALTRMVDDIAAGKAPGGDAVSCRGEVRELMEKVNALAARVSPAS